MPLPILAFVSEVHLQNAYKPRDVTLSGIVMFVRLAQYAKAPNPIPVMLLGMVYSVSPAGANAIRVLFWLIFYHYLLPIIR